AEPRRLRCAGRADFGAAVEKKTLARCLPEPTVDGLEAAVVEKAVEAVGRVDKLTPPRGPIRHFRERSSGKDGQVRVKDSGTRNGENHRWRCTSDRIVTSARPPASRRKG